MTESILRKIDQQGLFYLGRQISFTGKKSNQEPVLYSSKDLTTHAVCIGMTGSGKTGLGIALLEEAVLDGIPAIIIDPKGDMGNLLLAFPNLLPSDFLPWIDPEEAERQGIPSEIYAKNVADEWKRGLEDWNEPVERIKRFKDLGNFTIYTPNSQAGVPLSILNSLEAPSPELMDDAEVFRDRITSTVSSLLGLIGVDSDPINSRSHILLSTLFANAWKKHQRLDLPALIQQVQSPPLDKIGVLPVDTFFPPKERLDLSMKLNNLLAAPGFQSWMEGEPLDIQQMLYEGDGRPRHAIITINHLSDQERIFFVTLLLNQVIEWMRRQTGTSSLRAILYMDEIFGFFPPIAMPSTKIPMLTLLKQARAFGLGVVLTTQNPVDLDYKGLANCGTWFIGKLQTERDKTRVIEGLKTTVTGEAEHSFSQLLEACKKRVFLMYSIHQSAPYLFETRWTLSYLRGPLTLANIRMLMAKQREKQPVKSNSDSLSAGASSHEVPLPNIPQYYLKTSSGAQYVPQAIAFAQLHFINAKTSTDLWQERVLSFAISNNQDPDWNTVKDLSLEQEYLTKEKPVNASFNSLPLCFIEEKSYVALKKATLLYLYQSQTLDLLYTAEYKLFSKPNETENDFLSRLGEIKQDKLNSEATKIRQNYEEKIRSLREKIQRFQVKKEKEKQQVFTQKLLSWLSFATTLIGAIISALFGKRRITQSTISQTGTSIRHASRIGKDQQDLSYTEASLEDLEKQLSELEKEREDKLNTLNSQMDISKISLEKLQLRPKKTDITLTSLGILWSNP